MRKTLLVAVNLLPVLFLFGKEAKKPNIVVIMCDDMGYGDLSCYGHKIIQTPNIDSLASTGIRLTNFYSAAPVSSPSRVGLLTGRSPNRAGVFDFILSGTSKRDDNADMVHLQTFQEAIPARLKTAGYATCLVGKWHCSSLFNSPKQPQPDYFGFDYWFSTHNNAAPSHENPKNFVRNGKPVGEIIGFSSQIVVSEAMDWLNAKKDDNPFFLEICFHEPHVPIASPPELVEKYLPLAINHYQAEYFANVENVDIAVGRMIEYLKKNISGETLVIFTSDNGPETLFRYDKAFKSYGSSGELKGHKLWTNEAGFRVPCIINNLGNNKFTGTSDAVVSALDFMPTFCELADAKLPQNKLDGISVAKFLKTGNLNRKKPLIWTFYNAVNDHVVAMRLGDWKIMAKLKSGEEIIPKYIIVNNINEEELKNAKLTDFILYNLKNDISETTDVSLQNQKVLMKLKKRFQKEYAELTADSYVWRR